MEMKLKLARLICLMLPLAACQGLPPAAPGVSTTADRGRAFAQASCSGCHAVARFGSSSNPDAPPFPAIANQEGLSAESLTYWLRGAHNYPQEMDFHLNERQVEELVAYLLTLRDPNYRRPPD
jgi:mono/diheme cytochrome c family protein